ncbi:MAG TPA: hypothetical protein VIV40_00900 [Kofleriaceae bacterium]
MRSGAMVMLVILAGCGDDDCCTMTPIDAAVDAAVDTVVIDSPPLPAVHQHYVIDQLLLPATNTQARDYGLDLNSDGTVDNQFGMVISTLAGMGLDSQTAQDKLLDTGTAIMLGDLGADDLVAESTATFTIYQGANPTPPACASAQDTVCRKHFTGTATFSLEAGAPIDTPLLGAIVNSELTAGPGHLTIDLVLLASMPIRVTLLGARVKLTSSATSETGKLAGAVSMADMNTKVIPAMRNGFEAAVMADCTMLSSPPACGCPADTTGKTLLGLFDTDPKDCSISVSEVQNNSLIVSLFTPDVTVEGMPALSLGVAVHAVGAGFTAP